MKTLVALCLVLLASEAFGATTLKKRAADSGSDSNGDGDSDSSGPYMSSQDESSLSSGSGSDSNGDGDSDSSDGQSSMSRSIQSIGSGSDSNMDGNSDSSQFGGSQDLSNSDKDNSGSDTNNDGNSDSSLEEDGYSSLEDSSFADSDTIGERGSNSDSDGDGNSDSSAEGGTIQRLDTEDIQSFASGRFSLSDLSPSLKKLVEERINNSAPSVTCVNTLLFSALAAVCRALLA